MPANLGIDNYEKLGDIGNGKAYSSIKNV